MASSFDSKYKNIARWIEEHQGHLEIGYDVDSPLDSFIALDRLWWYALVGQRQL